MTWNDCWLRGKEAGSQSSEDEEMTSMSPSRKQATGARALALVLVEKRGTSAQPSSRESPEPNPPCEPMHTYLRYPKSECGVVIEMTPVPLTHISEQDVDGGKICAVRGSGSRPCTYLLEIRLSEEIHDDDALKRDAGVLSGRLDLSKEDTVKMEHGAFLARYAYVWDRIVHNDPEYRGRRKPGGIELDDDVAKALREERYKLYSEKGIRMVNIAVMCAAFLQGCVQSSINGSSLYAKQLGINENSTQDAWKLGITNSIPFFTAAMLGCWLSIPINHIWGRRGAILLSAVLVGTTSLLAGLVPVMIKDPNGPRWQALLAIRAVNGIGMGIKAVSTPILASETAIQFWRGSFVLAWQLWVAFGIMLGFAFNLITTTAFPDNDLTLGLILGAPVIPALLLIGALWRCPESPRYYLRQEKPDYKRAFGALKKLRSKCELLAYKDMYLLHKSIEEEYKGFGAPSEPGRHVNFFTKFFDLFTQRRLRNALTSSSTVALAQQLCGRTLFISLLAGQDNTEGPNSDLEAIKRAMLLSLGFEPLGPGAVNFIFGLPAIRTIDSLGRRKWLITTLPLMFIFMAAAAVDCYSLDIPKALQDLPDLLRNNTNPPDFLDNSALGKSIQEFRVRKVVLVAICLYLHAVVYSPGLGPIPFTLASESFPLSYREIGCAFAIAVNLFFAGALSICVPALNANLKSYGLLFLFCGLTLVALVMVYLLVEETKELSLEQLNEVFNSSKSRFVGNNARQAWWWVRRFTWPDPEQPTPPVLRDWEESSIEMNAWEEDVPSAGPPRISADSGNGNLRPDSAGHESDYSYDSRDPRA
ncbi:hypothetical protein G7054_g11524 [Neopestalotiopsis clavispora]|nr:hypothetical protein G7054_g11524 [Neopestalotiopsis clavispora]